MIRSASIFLAAILLPSLVLAWLAVRSARDQQVLLEHQQAVISQDVTDSLAKSIDAQIDGVRSEFVQITQDLLARSAQSQAAAYDFDPALRDQWPPAEVGFAVDLRGNIYSPNRTDGASARTFREENERFLSNRENIEVYSSLNSQSLVAKQISNPSNPMGGNALAGTLNGADESSSDLKTVQAYHSPRATGSVAMSPSVSAAASSSVARSVTMPSPAPVDTDSAAALSSPSSSPVEQEDLLEAKKGRAGSIDSLQDKALVSIHEKNSSPTMAGAFPSPTASPPPADMPRADLAPPPPVTSTAAAPMDLSASSYQFTTKQAQKVNQTARQVLPQNNSNPATAMLSNTVPEESDFRRLIGDDTSGALARFLDNKLQLMVWYRPSTTSDLVFGAQLNQARLLERLRSVLQTPELKERDGSLASGGRSAAYCLALLDDTGHPVALSIPGFTGDWKHPFVATEIGETLPHWEAALYLTDPGQMSKSARTLQLTVGLIVILLVVAIVAGGSLIAADIRRQMRLAQQKTDFVSNVSHELKTPLTSIRMFADLLAEGRVTEPERQSTYLKIISAESARLTRLINNVLDFARQERGAPPGERRPCDLVETTRDVVETCLPHLETNGQSLSCEIEAESLPIVGDRDALAQIVLNLISNAEKYGGGEILIRVRRQETASGPLACVDVLDRGPGIPLRQVESIFLPFHRLHDSLSNGIPGSGLGLTLARRMARVHGGNVTYTPRAGGGSCFTLAVPLTQ